MELLTDDFWNFLEMHANDDVNRLRLKYASQRSEEISFAIEQIDARRKIGRKLPTFEQNSRLLFPSVLSAEQASSEDTAAYKQQLLQGRYDSVCDLTGGLGIDTYYLSMAVTRATYIERFPRYCEVATHNFKELHRDNIQVINVDCRDFLSASHEHHALYFIDPARRGIGNKRLYNLADCEPDVVQLLSMIRAEESALLLKASPMLDISQSLKDLETVSEIHILSVKNECKELLFLIDPKAVNTPPRIYCMNKTASGWQRFSFTAEEESLLPASASCTLRRYLYEPNSSILKAGAFKSISKTFDIEKLAASSHLYTTDCYISDFPGRVFEIIDVYPFSKSELKQCRLSYPQANVSTRNFPLSVEELRRKSGIKDGGDIYLFATTVNNDKMLIFGKKAES